VNERVKVLYLRTGSRGAEVVDAAGVERRYGIPPEVVPDFIALRGDPSDGLPGAKGIGEKTAADLLRRHGSVEAALDAWSRERPARVAGALRDYREDVLSFKDIATLRTVKVRRPADRDTNFTDGARAARARGMEQLAARLERAGAAA
jgi:DNA polymerase-1